MVRKWRGARRTELHVLFGFEPPDRRRLAFSPSPIIASLAADFRNDRSHQAVRDIGGFDYTAQVGEELDMWVQAVRARALAAVPRPRCIPRPWGNMVRHSPRVNRDVDWIES